MLQWTQGCTYYFKMAFCVSLDKFLVVEFLGYKAIPTLLLSCGQKFGWDIKVSSGMSGWWCLTRVQRIRTCLFKSGFSGDPGCKANFFGYRAKVLIGLELGLPGQYQRKSQAILPIEEEQRRTKKHLYLKILLLFLYYFILGLKLQNTKGYRVESFY